MHVKEGMEESEKESKKGFSPVTDRESPDIGKKFVLSFLEFTQKRESPGIGKKL